MDRPVWTHELASNEIQEQLREKSKKDFISLFEPGRTNGDRIRMMADEDLAVVVMCPHDIGNEMCTAEGKCVDCCLEWLKSAVEE